MEDLAGPSSMTAGRRLIAWWQAEGSRVGVAELATQLSRRIPGPMRLSDLAALDDPAFVQGLHEWSMTHGILGLVLNSLRRSSQLDALAPSSSRRLLAPLRVLRAQAMLWDLERTRVVSFLRHERIDPLVLKGGALREMVYEEPSDRPLGDLDLLVEPAELDAAVRALQRAGYSLAENPTEIEWYRRLHFHLTLINPNGFEVELHWGLSQPSSAWQLDQEGFLSRSRSLQTATTTLRVPAGEDMLLHLCTQNIEDSFSKLRRLVDIDRIVARTSIDWDAVVMRARAGRVEAVTGLSLHLANRLLGASCPEETIRTLLSSTLVRFHLAAMRPDLGILTGRGPDMAVYTRALSVWLASPGVRVMQLRHSLTKQGWPLKSDSRKRFPSLAAEAFGLACFHLLLWARGLLRKRPQAPSNSNPGFWDCYHPTTQ